MEENVLHHIMYRLANAKLCFYPYPHFYVENIFPDGFYQDLLSHLPESAFFKQLSESGIVDPNAYTQRFILPLQEEELSQLPFALCLFWNDFINALNSNTWISFLLELFAQQLKPRFEAHYEKIYFSSTAHLMRDLSDYSIGPHTDHPIRALTLLFYLPSTNALSGLGTSIYCPRNASFECEGFHHYPFNDFIRLFTAPFHPNSLFGFIKTNRSFHGVEPIAEKGIERNLLSYYLQWNHK